MSIKRYIASKDSSITNAFKSNLSTRGVSGNMGASDILEVFSIYAQAASGSSESCRTLIKFPIDTIKSDRDDKAIPASGSVDFILRVYNAKHAETLPKNFTLLITPISGTTSTSWDWDEGRGLDMEEYTDKHAVNWISASTTNLWAVQGGDFYTSSFVVGTTLPSYEQAFVDGTEDVEVNITSLVEEWISGTLNPTTDHVRRNHGLGLLLTGSQETGSQSYYTKRFFARTSEFFFKRPTIEARWNSSKADDYANFFLSSSLASAEDNLNTIYLYNSIRGQKKNIPAVGTKPILLSLYSALTASASALKLPVGGNVITEGDTNVTGGYVEVGVYSASLAHATSSVTSIYPVWHSGSVQYHSGSLITVKSFDSLDYDPNPKHVTTITNFKTIYSNEEVARIRLYVRQKDWSPTIYTTATTSISTEIIEKAYYRIFRIVDDLEVVSYGTGSKQHTLMSFDSTGNYFNFDMSMLEKDYAYGMKFVFYVNGKYVEQPETFKFRIEG